MSSRGFSSWAMKRSSKGAPTFCSTTHRNTPRPAAHAACALCATAKIAAAFASRQRARRCLPRHAGKSSSAFTGSTARAAATAATDWVSPSPSALSAGPGAGCGLRVRRMIPAVSSSSRSALARPPRANVSQAAETPISGGAPYGQACHLSVSGRAEDSL